MTTNSRRVRAIGTDSSTTGRAEFVAGLVRGVRASLADLEDPAYILRLGLERVADSIHRRIGELQAARDEAGAKDTPKESDGIPLAT